MQTAFGLTEAEWFVCPNPTRLVKRLRNHGARTSGRKYLLLACAYELDTPHANLSGLGREMLECVRRSVDSGSAEACSPAEIRRLLTVRFTDRLPAGGLLLSTFCFTPQAANLLGVNSRVVNEFLSLALRFGVGWAGANTVSVAVESHIRRQTFREIRDDLNGLVRRPPAREVREEVLRRLPDKDRDELRHIRWDGNQIPGRIQKRLQGIVARTRLSEARSRMADYVRDIFGHPLRKTVIDPAWLVWNHGAVRHIAEQIAASGNFADMPILADALEDAGCTDEELLRHCREERTHVPGCWALDAVLGRG